jgi:hypothetical protein
LRIAKRLELLDFASMVSKDHSGSGFDPFTVEQLMQAAERLDRIAGFVQQPDLAERLLKLAIEYREQAKRMGGT